MKLLSPVFFFFAIAMGSTLSAQVAGRIKSDTGQPVEGVYITIKDQSNYTFTNALGRFQIDVPESGSHVLIFNALGYSLKEVEVTDGQSYDVELEGKPILVEEVDIIPKTDNLETLSKIDLSNSTVRSSQDVLQRVPGLFIGQHAGGGKAEQIFLRGFDIDHGKDLLITVDGMPVNMVSKSHGQ
ncbi:MAG: carboxypeptidase-like regulatory domain-containing protein, partial [Flavobacteriales bacterium]|nr:carboxypeptidase-like regulatory domain-containing protein [Flavobacteriales bacterium]